MTTAERLLMQMWAGVGGDPEHASEVRFTGAGSLPSIFAVSDLASASVAAAARGIAELVAQQTGAAPSAEVDRRLASMWFGTSLRPQGWQPPPPWDPIAGDYQSADGWIRLHTNAPRHRSAALAVLGIPAERAVVERAVATWRGEDLESAVVGQGGAAALMRSREDWTRHPQGRAVAEEPLVHVEERRPGTRPSRTAPLERPLANVRVLDVTRVIAGPVATRFLAGFGAEVLRIDAPDWDEPGVVADMTLGKRTARLDLRERDDRARFAQLLATSDVFVHGLRTDALEELGFGAEERERLRPGLVDVSLNAYGWTGPWLPRRGFDSLVQMSTGIAAEGMRRASANTPVPLPVQALDHATGYLLAAAVLRGLVVQRATGSGWRARASLARTAEALVQASVEETAEPLTPEGTADVADTLEKTAWGPARRLRPPLSIAGIPMRWDLPASPLGAVAAKWT